MGCNQSASKPVARPDNNMATALGSSSSHNGNNGVAASLVTNAESDASPNPATTATRKNTASSTTFPAAATTANGTSSSSSSSPAAIVHVSKQRPLVVCGPSGVGKGTLLARLLKEYPHIFAKSISHTTRAPRAGEENGKHYHFTHADALLQSVQDGHFIEHANVHGNYYGTSISSVAHVMDTGKICLLEIDIQGVLSVKKVESLNPISIFVRAPTFEDLHKRLTARASETEHTMQKRLDTARNEMDFFYTNRSIFEADLINDEFEPSYARLIETIKKLYPSVQLTNPVQQQPQQ